MMRLLSLAAIARQAGISPVTAKKFVSNISDIQVDVNGRVMYREDRLLDFIRSGGNQAVQRPAIGA